MSDTYTKLFRGLVASTIVSEPLATRWLWITLLSQSDSRGCVWGSVPGLARIANISIEECEAALACFLSPDTYSRTKDNDGRRLEVLDGGWRLLNHAKYNAVRSEAERAEYKREWDRKNRPSGHARQAEANTTVRTQSDSPTVGDQDPIPPTAATPPALALALEDQKQEQGARKAARKPAGMTFSDWIASLNGEMAIPENDPVYRFADETGIPDDFVALTWLAFEDRYSQEPKKYEKWRVVFRKAIKGNWMRIWYATPDGGYALTTVGETWRRAAASRASA